MHKVKFATGRHGQLLGYIAGIPCVLARADSQAAAGETWLVEVTGTNPRRTLAYVRAVRPFRNTPEDRRTVMHPHVDFRTGTVRLGHRFVFPVEHTIYAQMWDDYRTLTENMHAVIIRGDRAIRWHKKGKPPEVLPLARFATKYRRQPLLGDSADIERFLANLEDLRREAIEEARRKKLKGQEVLGL